ncbi:hypothetical protein I5J36_gp61 [Mycobacterium phage Mendokysei]|uniref:Uncharacterized protein n=1 Tax=Mycobacterium phage Mendokysei TaxID=2099637 RepID=A0A2P1CGD1_9CAUD|nr:hypothetical protein I5J36_gp61 [Mycobacterium phage Mendokysei]AVJ50277.1 hypothetical protein SEA_MENDOKYSEI_61 [Mycobacterium phage Mendokysei]
MADTSPGIGPSGPINHYWTKGKGAAKWVSSPHPYTTLVALLEKYISSSQAHGLAAEYYHEVFGRWPGQHHGNR